MENVSFVNKRGERLAGIIHDSKEKKRGILVCHGFMSSKDDKVDLSEQLSENFTVLRFDLSGHGDSEGELKDITLTRLLDDMDSAILFLKTKGIQNIGIIGHSLGGALAILTANKAKAIFSIAGPTDFKMRTLNEYGLDNFDQDAKNHDFYKVIKETKTPILFLHGSTDDVVPVWHSEKGMRFANRESKLEIIDGMGHTYSNPEHYEKIVSLAKEWFSSHV
jgi:uncharacterized protein